MVQVASSVLSRWACEVPPLPWAAGAGGCRCPRSSTARLRIWRLRQGRACLQPDGRWSGHWPRVGRGLPPRLLGGGAGPAGEALSRLLRLVGQSCAPGQEAGCSLWTRVAQAAPSGTRTLPSACWVLPPPCSRTVAPCPSVDIAARFRPWEGYPGGQVTGQEGPPGSWKLTHLALVTPTACAAAVWGLELRGQWRRAGPAGRCTQAGAALVPRPGDLHGFPVQPSPFPPRVASPASPWVPVPGFLFSEVPE